MGADFGKDYSMISKKMKKLIDKGERRFIIYPYGYIGRVVEDILDRQYKIKPEYIIDNRLCDVNDSIKPANFLNELDAEKYILILSVEEPTIVESIRFSAFSRFRRDRIFELFDWGSHSDLRVSWIRRFSDFVYDRQLKGSVAECGVFRGDTARYINEFFPDRPCYLFDSFEGFRDSDIEKEHDKLETSDFFDDAISGFSNTSEQFVFNRMPNKDMIRIKKGFIPDTFVGIDDTFCYVNIDVDLYIPMLEAIKFFYPKMERGGVMTLHDYYTGGYLPGVEKAVRDYEKERGIVLCKIPSEATSNLIIVKE